MGPRNLLDLLLVGSSSTAATAILLSTQDAGFDHRAAAQQVAAELSGDYIVQNGSYTFFHLEDCTSLDLPTCFALNADTPYGLTALPLAPGESVFDDCDTKTKRCGTGCLADGYDLDQGVCSEDNHPIHWRLGENEAVLVIGMAPPEAVYWSITSYLWTGAYASSPRTEPMNLDPWLYRFAVACPDGPGRCARFASLGNPLNHQTLQSRTNGTGYSEPFALVMTASKEAWDAVSAAAELAGAPTFLHPVPANVVNLGTDGNDKDTLGQLLRIAYPADQGASDAYFSAAPLSVLRITARSPPAPAPGSSFSREDLSYADRTTGTMERADGVYNHEELKVALAELEAAIVQAHSDGPPASPFMKPYFVTGMDCVDMGTECNGDCPDAIYPLSTNIVYAEACQITMMSTILPILCVLTGLCCACCFVAPNGSRGCRRPENVPDEESRAEATDWYWARYGCCRPAAKGIMSWKLGLAISGISGFLMAAGMSSWFYGSFCSWGRGATIDGGEGDFYVVYGVNHKATGKAAYSSITAYHREKLLGLYTASSEEGFVGSAARYLGEGHPANPYLYAYRFARDCTASGLDGSCFSVPKTGSEPLPEGESILWIERAYLNPETQTAPDDNEVIYPYVKHFW